MCSVPFRTLILTFLAGGSARLAAAPSSPPVTAAAGEANSCALAWGLAGIMALLAIAATIYAVLLRRQLAAALAMPHGKDSHDVLTGLPDRLLFMEFSRKVLANASRHGSLFSLLFLELDNLGTISEEHGEGTADLLVQAAARRIEAAIRQGDLVARLQGGRFAVLLDSVRGRAGLTQVVARLGETIGAAYTIEGKELAPGCSIGISFFPSDGDQLSDLMQKADEALEAAIQSGGKRNVFYDELPLPPA